MEDKREMEEKNCIECGKLFKEFLMAQECQICDNGEYESVRDYGTVYITCFQCGGSGELVHKSSHCHACCEKILYENDL